MDFDDIEMGEEVQETPSADEPQEVVETTDEVVEQETTKTIESDIPDTQVKDKTVPLDVVTALKEQNRELKLQNEKILDMLLKGQQPQVQQPKEPEIELDDESFVDGKTVKQLITQVKNEVLKQVQAKEQSRMAETTATQIAEAKAQYSDYEDVHQFVMKEAAKNPGIEAYIMKSSNPPAEMYKFGKFLMGQSVPATQQPAKQTAKTAVQTAAKIEQNQQQPRTLSTAKGNSVVANTVEEYVNGIWDEL
jgi:hypothetical protein